MKFCDKGLIELEQCGRPGSIGDSCAETCRYINLIHYCGTGFEKLGMPRITMFRTEEGYLRHPDVPEGWREDDFTTDQGLPLYLAFVAEEYIKEPERMIERIRMAGWRTGNGDFVSPLFYGVLNKKRWLVKSCLWSQAQIFKIPFRWSDSKKWFESSSGSSADFLNWFQVAMTIPESNKWVARDVLWQKICDYYKPEPNVDWMLDFYAQAIKKFYRT